MNSDTILTSALRGAATALLPACFYFFWGRNLPVEVILFSSIFLAPGGAAAGALAFHLTTRNPKFDRYLPVVYLLGIGISIGVAYPIALVVTAIAGISARSPSRLDLILAAIVGGLAAHFIQKRVIDRQRPDSSLERTRDR
jgi:hypothetical protein